MGACSDRGFVMLDRLRAALSRLGPYSDLLRLQSSEISLLASFPACAGVALVSGGVLETVGLCLLIMVAAVAVRSAGCVINDIFDRNIDGHVARTKNRPLASGRLTVRHALVALVPLVGVACLILLLTNALSFYLSVFCALGIVVYPLMKRFFSYPQVVLGIVWNCGVLIGSAMAADKITLGAVLIYIGCVFWTTAFDTIYAHQDKKDDAALGLKSTALKFGDNARIYVRRLYLLTITMWTSAGFVSLLGWPYYVAMLLCVGIFYYQYKKTDFDNADRCMYMFKTNIYAGAMLFVGVCLGRGF